MINNGLKGTVKTDICIVGSGIGGGTLARKLSNSGRTFVIIEAGSWEGNSQHNVSYENIGHKFGVRSTTTIQIGGTSNLWHGVLSPLDRIDFEKRDWIPNSGWPIDYDELLPFYHEASQLLKVENFNYFYPDSLSTNFIQQLKKLSFNRSYLKNKLFQQPVPRVNFKNIVKDICQFSVNNHLHYNSTALQLISNEDKIIKLKVGNADGSFGYVEANDFVVCSGALESPRLLLNSGVNNENIGKYLMDHPMGTLCQLEFLKPARFPIYSDTKYSKNMKIKSGLELVNILQKKLKMPNHNFFLRPSFVKGVDDESEKIKLSLLAFKDGKVSMQDFVKVLTNLNVIRQLLVYKLSYNVRFKYADLFFVTEQMPNKNSYVALSSNKDKWGYNSALVNWEVSKKDIESVKSFFKLLLTDIFPDENYRFTNSLDDFNWENVFTSAIHHVGTCRMAFNKYEGVVNKELKVFDFENLYVCDGSIFSTAGNVNNGLTISAFSCRLAKLLGEKK